MVVKRRRLGQSGQAILEYTLLVLIILGLLGGVVYQFNTAFRSYADRLFVGENSYFGCLIKKGILPGTGTEVCPPPKFRMADGKQLPNMGPSGGEGSGGGQGLGKGSLENKNSMPSSGRGSEGRSGTIAFSNADKKNGGIKSSSLNASGAEKKEKANTGSDGVSSSASGGSDSTTVASAETGFGYNKRRQNTTEENYQEKAATTVPASERDMKTAREIAQAKKKKEKKADFVDEDNFSFSNIFKYLVIIALVFGIIFFVGSQFLAVSRSQKRK